MTIIPSVTATASRSHAAMTGMRSKVAVTGGRPARAATTHVAAVPWQAPPHETRRLPEAGTAVRVALDPMFTFWEQAVAQAAPSGHFTAPSVGAVMVTGTCAAFR